MLIQVIFASVFVCCIIFACIFGGKAGKNVSLILSVAVVATIPASFLSWRTGLLSWPMLVVDSLCFFALVGLAFGSSRFWPIWLAGLQLAAIASHLAVIAVPENMTILYDAISRFWSVPILIIMVIGIYLDQRQQALN